MGKREMRKVDGRVLGEEGLLVYDLKKTCFERI